MAGTDYNFDELDAWVEKLAQTIESQYPKEFEQMVIQIAYELQGLVKEKTPVDTSRLADSWTVGPIAKQGDTYVIEVYTNVKYAEPVEYGHRTRRGKGKKSSKVARKAFVPGAHMMQISLDKVAARLPGYLQEWLSDFISTHDL